MVPVKFVLPLMTLVVEIYQDPLLVFINRIMGNNLQEEGFSTLTYHQDIFKLSQATAYMF